MFLKIGNNINLQLFAHLFFCQINNTSKKTILEVLS